MKAWLGLRDSLHYRREVFAAGLSACGYRVEHRITDRPGPDDVLVIWNRYGEFARCAAAFESRGLPVLIAENATWGNDFAGDRWYSITRNLHNTLGKFPVGGPERWDGLGVTLAPWREWGEELIVLPQRGIGPPGVAMPFAWLKQVEDRLRALGFRYRVRGHPGTKAVLPLLDDLRHAEAVVTWASGGAVKALAAGIPVFYDYRHWIAGEAGKLVLSLFLAEAPKRSDADRLAMFRALAWAQWTLKEIEHGTPFRRLLAGAV